MSVKKVIDKNDLRKLMKEKAITTSSSQQKVESSFANYTYNANGQLWCTLCKRQVKSSILWNAHVQSRTHRELVKVDAESNVLQPRAPVASLKRKASNIDEVASNEKKLSRAEDTTPSSSWSLISNSSRSEAESNVAEIVCGSPMESDDEMSGGVFQASVTTAAIQFPSDLSTEPVAEPGILSNGMQAITSLSEQLPEGFFDDPKMDAKVRQVPYRDKMEEEWELFQKSMKEETMVSEALVEEDDDVREVERNIEEIDDQLCRWSRVTQLLQKREQCTTGIKVRQSGSSTVDSDSEHDLDPNEFSDWRAGGK